MNTNLLFQNVYFIGDDLEIKTEIFWVILLKYAKNKKLLFECAEYDYYYDFIYETYLNDYNTKECFFDLNQATEKQKQLKDIYL